MIQKESWYVESDSLEKQHRRLIEMAERGEIPPERFMQLMLRIHGKGNQIQEGVQFLSKNRSGQLTMTPEWIVFHKDWVNDISDLRNRLANVLLWGVRMPRFSKRTVSGIWAALYKHFSGNGKMHGIYEYVSILHSKFSQVGSTASAGYGWLEGFVGDSWNISEAEFNKYVQEVIQKAEEFMETSARPEFAAAWDEPPREIAEAVGG